MHSSLDYKVNVYFSCCWKVRTAQLLKNSPQPSVYFLIFSPARILSVPPDFTSVCHLTLMENVSLNETKYPERKSVSFTDCQDNIGREAFLGSLSPAAKTWSETDGMDGWVEDVLMDGWTAGCLCLCVKEVKRSLCLWCHPPPSPSSSHNVTARAQTLTRHCL